MSRAKKYNEGEVIEKAMQLFWRNGYESTSMNMLEKEMGINKFSIYASFKNKEGVFVESLKMYRKNVHCITKKLKEASADLDSVKQYFYDFLDFSQDGTNKKGCLVVNTVNEFGERAEPSISLETKIFSQHIKGLFAEKLKGDKNKDEAMIEKQANYLLASVMGLSLVSKIFTGAQIDDYIEMVFRNL
ncbi:MAG: TetR/AcrR family transcriptional regulator [Pricia sp.]